MGVIPAPAGAEELESLVVSLFRLRVGGSELSFFGGSVQLVFAQNPPAKADHAQRRDQESGTQPEPGRHPLADKQDHACNYRQIDG